MINEEKLKLISCVCVIGSLIFAIAAGFLIHKIAGFIITSGVLYILGWAAFRAARDEKQESEASK